MKRLERLSAAAALLCAAAAASLAPAAPRNAAQIARGKYLVEQVAMCADCHTPRGERGAFDRSKWLQGAALGFAPKEPIPGFSGYAPGIAGLSGWNDAEAVKVLSTGLTAGGKPLAPPMPQYKMTRADAAAVVAYLKSLPTGD
jgi:mono/diheme cytochrome c family protein